MTAAKIMKLLITTGGGHHCASGRVQEADVSNNKALGQTSHDLQGKWIIMFYYQNGDSEDNAVVMIVKHVICEYVSITTHATLQQVSVTTYAT